jgi:predicted CXXCH cytochrome family protein
MLVKTPGTGLRSRLRICERRAVRWPLVLVAVAGCHGHDAPAPAPAPAPKLVDAAPPVPPPAPVPPNPYVGSTTCSDCHDKEYKAWRKSWHARALSPAERKYVVGNFGGAHFAGTSSEAWMTRAKGKPVMRTHGPDGELADFAVSWVIGGKRMQDDVTVFPDGRWQVLPVYFHTTKHEWVDYTEAKQGALTPDHPFYWTNARRMANHECLDCHTTNLSVAYDETSHQWTTTFTDGSVACESCHGPGGIHSDSSAKKDIIHPLNSGAVGVSACARCHGPRKPLWPLNDPEHPFRLGDSYDEYYDPIVVTMPGGGTSSDFFPSGKPSTSSFEYQAMLQSACFRKGGATCLTCHTAPHDAKRPADLRKDPDALCADCHRIDKDHGHHKHVKCIDCHMPKIVSGVLDHFADHALDVPDPKLAITHKEANACTACHADKKPEDLVAAVQTWWPDAGKRQARRERLADAFDEATAKTSLPALLGVLDDTTEAPTLRGAAAVVLGRRVGPRSAVTLAPLLADPSVVIRAKACEALGDAHASAAGDAVAKHLEDKEIRVQLACALALLDMRDPRGEPALQRLADAPATSHLMLPHLELGMAAGRRKDYQTARTQLEWVAKLNPSYTDALVDLAATDAELGDFAAARARIAQVLQLEPHHRGALSLQAKLPH